MRCTRIRAGRPGTQFVLARAPKLSASLFDPLGPGAGGVAIVEGRTDDVLNASDVVLTASGTATVQTALHEKPDGDPLQAVAVDLSARASRS